MKSSTTHIWSAEQESIFEWFANGAGHLKVEALAGTGKTTTIKAAFEFAPEQRILYAVFNKRNQKEAESKITDTRVEVKTLHSLGFAFIKRVWSNAKPDNNIECERCERVLPSNATPEQVGLLAKLVAYAKNTTINPTVEDLERICQDQDIDFSGCNFSALFLAYNVLEMSKVRERDGRISFNDMVWLPVAMAITRPWYDLVCVDEAQDMNLPQLSMAKLACKKGGRIVVVGDSRQAIYGFRGAVQNGMSMMKITLRASELFLTTTYRCPKSVVAIASDTVKNYKAAPEAPDGVVGNLNGFAFISKLKVGDAVLSRLNAPLMPLALALLRKDVPARIEGRDIGAQLVGMVKSMKAKTVSTFIEKVGAWRDKQHERLERAKDAEKKLEQIDDVAQTLLAIAEGAKSVADIETRLANLFQDSDENSRPAVVLSSVHKAKGLEWPRVFLLADTFRTGGSVEEQNIHYVAITRTMRELYFVRDAHGKVLEVSTAEPPAPVDEPSKILPVAPVVQRRYDNETPLPSHTHRRPGVVFIHAGIEYVVTRLGPSNAIARAMTRLSTTIKNGLTGEEKEFKRAAREIEVSTQIEPGAIVRRLTEDELKDFISNPARADGRDNKSGATERENGMAKAAKTKKVKSDLPTQGRAAYVHKLKAGGASKADALVKAQANYDITPGLFAKIWDRDARGEGGEKKKPAKAAKGGKGAAKAKKTPPPRRVAPKPAPSASAPAAGEPVEGEEAGEASE